MLEKGLSYTEIGILYALREILINIAEIPSGIFADTYGRKSSLAGSFVFYIFSFLIFYLAQSFSLFLMAFILYGIADAFRSGTHKGMIMDYLKINELYEHKTNYYGHTRSCSQKGSAISALIAGVIVLYFGAYKNVFLLSVIPYLINFFLILSYPKELNKVRISTVQKKKPTFKDTLQFFLSNVKNIKVLGIVNTSAIHTAFQKAGKDYIQPVMLHVVMILPFLNSYDAEKKNGLFIGILYFIIFMFTAQASKRASKIDQQTKYDTPFISLIYGFGFGILAGVFYLTTWWLAALLAFTGIYIVENIRKPILTGLLAEHVPNEILTSVISLQSLWKTIITVMLSLLLGVLADKMNVGWALTITSSLLMLVSVFLKLLSSHNHKKE